MPRPHSPTEPPADPSFGRSVDEPDSALLDVSWLAAPGRRSRTRTGLLAALAVLLVFLGGVEAQKRWGVSDSAGAGGAGGAQAFLRGGSPPSGGERFRSSSVGTSQATAGATPAVIGTLTRIHGRTWTVRDLGGTAHTVKLTGSTTVTRKAARATRPIRAGSTVTVQGSTQGKTVTATAITLR